MDVDDDVDVMAVEVGVTIAFAQLIPENPAGHVQFATPFTFVQVPPLKVKIEFK